MVWLQRSQKSKRDIFNALWAITVWPTAAEEEAPPAQLSPAEALAQEPRQHGSSRPGAGSTGVPCACSCLPVKQMIWMLYHIQFVNISPTPDFLLA